MPAPDPARPAAPVYCTEVRAPGSWLWEADTRRAVVEVLPDTVPIAWLTWGGLEDAAPQVDTVFAQVAVVDRGLPGWGRMPDTVSLVRTRRDPECRLHVGDRLEPGRRYIVAATRRPDSLMLGGPPSFQVLPGPGPRLSPSDAPDEAAAYVEWFDMMRRLPPRAAWERDCTTVVDAISEWATARYPNGAPPYGPLVEDVQLGCDAWTATRPDPAELEWYAGLDTLPAGVHVLALDSLYGIEADDAQTAAVQMQLFGPEIDGEPFYGLHRGRWRYRYDRTRLEDGRCRLTNARVMLRSVITIPHLTNRETAPAAMRAAWDDYLAAIRLHEEGHRSLAVEVLREFWSAVEGAVVDSCDTAREAVQVWASEASPEWRRVQEAYDDETDHGMTQGAVWPPRR